MDKEKKIPINPNRKPAGWRTASWTRSPAEIWKKCLKK